MTVQKPAPLAAPGILQGLEISTGPATARASGLSRQPPQGLNRT